MNKTELKKYFNRANENNKEKFLNKYIKYENGFLITDSCSIIKLNNDYGVLTELKDNVKDYLTKIFEDFRFNFNLHTKDITKDLENFEEKHFRFIKEYSGDIKEENEIINYGVDTKRLNNIKNIIKANKIEIVSKYSYDYVYAIRLENTKTNEYAYLLPIKVY